MTHMDDIPTGELAVHSLFNHGEYNGNPATRCATVFEADEVDHEDLQVRGEVLWTSDHRVDEGGRISVPPEDVVPLGR